MARDTKKIVKIVLLVIVVVIIFTIVFALLFVLLFGGGNDDETENLPADYIKEKNDCELKGGIWTQNNSLEIFFNLVGIV